MWSQDLLSQPQKKALLRCLIDKVVIHRTQRDTAQTRIVWKGGEVTAMALPIPVGSWSELSKTALSWSSTSWICITKGLTMR